MCQLLSQTCRSLIVLLDCVMPEAVFDTVMSSLAKVLGDFIFVIVLYDSLSNFHKLHVPRFLAVKELRGHFSDRCLGLLSVEALV